MKKLLSIILCFMLCLSFVGCSSDAPASDASSDAKTEAEEKQEEPKLSLQLSDGTYIVGEDLDPGMYILVKHEDEYMGSYDITTDTTGDVESMVDSNAFENFTYIEVSEGQYIQLDGCDLCLIDEINKDFSNDSELTNGMFIVGKDLEPGEYKLEDVDPDDDVDGWYSLYNKLSGGYENSPDLQDSDFFSGSKLITLKDGQYLMLNSDTKLVK